MEDKKVKTEKMGFFSRLKTAIFKLEDYGKFLNEGPTPAFKYFFILILIITVIIVGFVTYDFSKITHKIYNYLENELPDFSYENGNLNFSNYVEAYDHDYNFKLIINTSDDAENNLKEYKNKIYDSGYGLILLRDKAIYKSGEQEIEDSYVNLIGTMTANPKTGESDETVLTTLNKSELLNSINNLDLNTLVIMYFFICIIINYISNMLIFLSDLCMVAIIGWCIARICGINIKMIGMMEITIYGLTLSIVLKCIYAIISLNGFTSEYFEIIYFLISYVYIIAAILMIKDDLIKQQQEVNKIEEVQKQVKQELESDKEKNLEDLKEDDKTNLPTDDKEIEDEKQNKEDNEPDGSEI